MKKTKPVIWFLSALLLLGLSSCAGARARTATEWEYPLQKVYNSGEAAVWLAVIQTLPQMGFVIDFMDKDLGIIRATDDIRRDAYSFFSGINYSMEVQIREVAPRTTMVFIEYPQIKSPLHERVGWDPEANIFEYIELHMSAR